MCLTILYYFINTIYGQEIDQREKLPQTFHDKYRQLTFQHVKDSQFFTGFLRAISRFLNAFYTFSDLDACFNLLIVRLFIQN